MTLYIDMLGLDQPYGPLSQSLYNPFFDIDQVFRFTVRFMVPIANVNVI